MNSAKSDVFTLEYTFVLGVLVSSKWYKSNNIRYRKMHGNNGIRAFFTAFSCACTYKIVILHAEKRE